MKISFDTKSFLVDGQRRLILSGEIHYFRLPRAEWRAVLEKAREAGLNSVCIIIPWNFHEAREGQWNFKGDHDLDAFLKLCKSMDLLVIARPGPYICAEWTFGGFPDWLHAKGITQYRNSDPSFLALVDKYLDKILGILARNQVSRGGSVFLVQIENEFDYGPQDPAYLKHLLRRFKQKLSVPLFFGLGDTRRGGGAAPGVMLAANFLDNGTVHMKNLRRIAGKGQPLMVSEFWTGGFSGWGKPHGPKPPEMIENYMTEILGAGATLINQYMFYGGTNFGDGAARQSGGDQFYCTQSYDLDAPLSEGLEISPKFQRLALWARRAKAMEPFILGAEEDKRKVRVTPKELVTTELAKGKSRFLFVYNPTAKLIKGQAQLEIALPFSLKPGQRKYFAFNIEASPSLLLRACSHPYLFYRLGNRLVVVAWGEMGEKVTLWGQGFALSAQVKDRPQKLPAKDFLFLVVSRHLAEQMNFDNLKQPFQLTKALAPKILPLTPKASFNEAALLKRLAARKDWQRAQPGLDLAEYGFSSSRAWFRLKFQASSRGKKHLVFPGIEDTFSIFSRGKHLGLYGRQGKGPHLELKVEQGENELLLLVENYGRFCFGTKLGEKKGVLMPIYDGGKTLPFDKGWSMKPSKGQVCARKKFKVPSWATRVRLNLHAGNIKMQVALNGKPIGQHPDFTGSGYEEFDLTQGLVRGENTLALFFKGSHHGFEKCDLLFLGPELPLSMETCEGLYAPEETKILGDKAWSKTKKGKFGFWRASFKALASKNLSSVWLKLLHNGRGSLWFNGHSLGHHRKEGPQQLYKLPLSWLKANNEVLVFEEEAGIPQRGELHFKFKRRPLDSQAI